MAADYKGRRSAGYLSRVTNATNGKTYIVSTVRLGRLEWETRVLREGFFGTLFNAFLPLLRIDAADRELARRVHHRVEEIAEERDPSDWQAAAHSMNKARTLSEIWLAEEDEGSGVSRGDR